MSTVSDEELEMEMEEIENDDLLDYGIKIKQESDLLSDNNSECDEVEYAKPKISAITEMSMLHGTSSKNGIVNKDSSQVREPTYTLDMHLFHKRKDKPPLYLLNPDDYPHDPQKQLQIRRATITYRHHQEKKELIRRLKEENANLKSVLEIYSNREDAIAEFCSCESVKKIISDFNPKNFVVTPTPPPKLPPLPPIKKFLRYQEVGQSNGVSKLSWPQPPQTPQSNRMIILRKNHSILPTTVSSVSSPTGLPWAYQTGNLQATQAQVQRIIRSHQERLNRMQSPNQQANNPLATVKTESKEESTKTKNPEVENILQQMHFAQLRLDLEKKKEGVQSKVEVKSDINRPQTSAASKPQVQPTVTVSNQNTFKVGPRISTSVLARSGIRLQNTNGIRIISPAGVGFLPVPTPSRAFGVPSGAHIRVLAPPPIPLLKPKGFVEIAPRMDCDSVPNSTLSHHPKPSSTDLKVRKYGPHTTTLLRQQNKSNTQLPPVEQPSPSSEVPLIIPKKEPIDILDEPSVDELNEIQIETTPRVPQEIKNQVSKCRFLSTESYSKTPTKKPLVSELTSSQNPAESDLNLLPIKDTDVTLKQKPLPIQIELEHTIKIKEEPLDNSTTHHRRSQRSSALCQPNAKDLLKGIIKKIPRAISTIKVTDSRDELSYARPSKKLKLGIE